MNGPVEHPPRAYQQHLSTWWWLTKWHYLKFMLRELSSVFVGWFVVVTLLQIRALSNGPAAYGEFEEWLKSPPLLVLNGISFLFVVFHAVTWFNVTPKAMPIRIGGKRVPDLLIVLPNYAAWLVLSVAVAWIVLRG
jgi:fumarate reductase subunit C